jgi:hypothetical protein
MIAAPCNLNPGAQAVGEAACVLHIAGSPRCAARRGCCARAMLRALSLDAVCETYRRCASSEMQQTVETLQFPKRNALSTERVVHLSDWMAATDVECWARPGAHVEVTDLHRVQRGKHSDLTGLGCSLILWWRVLQSSIPRTAPGDGTHGFRSDACRQASETIIFLENASSFWDLEYDHQL